ncbi:MAG: HAMP domain-containing histidine kinase [Actinobacteria bacterium]|nr:HAMP domain-containing histidine kinase [Actinomycetota bacterium]
MSNAWIVSGLDRLHPSVVVIVTVALLLIAWLVTLASGGTKTAFLHLFYLPILLSAVRWGVGSALLTAIAATLLSGPLMPLDVGADLPQPMTNWLTRGAFFVLVGMFVGALTGWVRAAGRRETALAEHERDLAIQRAAIIQTVSHEIRTPLTVIAGVAELLHHREDLVSERGRPLVDSLQRSTLRFRAMADMMLAAAEAGDEARIHPVTCTLNDVVTDTLSHLPGRVDAQRVLTSGDALLDEVLTVPEYVKLALRCVIDNALRFSPPQTPVEVVAARCGSRVRIEVRDRGPGIDPTFRDRAFEAFTQSDQSTTREIEGIGLGLYTARRLVNRLGGTIDLQPRQPTGTTATVEIPAPVAGDVAHDTDDARARADRIV